MFFHSSVHLFEEITLVYDLAFIVFPNFLTVKMVNLETFFNVFDMAVNVLCEELKENVCWHGSCGRCCEESG